MSECWEDVWRHRVEDRVGLWSQLSHTPDVPSLYMHHIYWYDKTTLKVEAFRGLGPPFHFDTQQTGSFIELFSLQFKNEVPQPPPCYKRR